MTTPLLSRTPMKIIVPSICIAVALASSPAFAIVRIVTNNSDNAPGSLRDTIASANPGDVIQFAAGIGSTITLASEIPINKSVIITGPGAGVLAIDGANLTRLFNVTAATTITDLTLKAGKAAQGGAISGSDVILSNCTLQSNHAQMSGGAIRTSGTWNISNCTFDSNTAAGDGGAVSSRDGTATIQYSTFTSNSAPFTAGGALDIEGTASFSVANSTFSGNSAFIGGAIYNGSYISLSDSAFFGNFASNAGVGGAIFNASTSDISRTNFSNNSTTGDGLGGAIYSDGTISITASTLSGNSTLDDGGGGAVYNDGTLSIRDSTLSGNVVGASINFAVQGGAIFNDGDLTIADSTVANNISGNDTQGAGIYNAGTTRLNDDTISGNSTSGSGGGVFNENGGTLIAANTIVAVNTASSGPDVFGVVTSQGYNLIGNSTDTSGLVSADMVNVNPQLGPLQNNGGATATMALMPTSPAIAAGNPAFDPNAFTPPMNTDQRGSPRVVNGRIDIGSYEATANRPPQINELTAPQTLECTSPQGTSASVAVTATDQDGDALTVQWLINNQVVQTNTIPSGNPSTSGSAVYTANYPLGTTTITASVSDGKTTITRCTTVTIRDTTPPAIHSVTANPNVLFPPNHKMVNVTIAVSATDNCDVNPKSKIISVSSNEAGGGQFQITGDLTLKLQAEREGGGKGRIYTIRVRCTDMSNNSSTGAVTVTVPKGGK